MDRKLYLMEIISQRLSYLQLRVTNNNSLNLTDINITAENFFRDLLNLLGYKYTNTNFSKQNAAFIDLIDETNKSAIQITSQNDNKKISESIKGFYANEKYNDYKLKLLLISKDAKKYKTDFGVKFDAKKDVIDVKRLLAEINDKDIDTISRISEYLSKNVLEQNNTKESTEVETIMALIQFLSQPKNRSLSKKGGNVDPHDKIFNRFSTHSDYLLERYADLMPVYYSALQTANKDLDDVMSIIISSYLKDESDIILNRNNNDPKKSIEDLVNFFYEKLSLNGIVSFDKQAIRFFLLDEMIKCNVFPNP